VDCPHDWRPIPLECACDLCVVFGTEDPLAGEFDAAPVPELPARWTPFSRAYFYFLAALGTTGEARRRARELYFRAQDEVPRHLVESLIARCERARLRVQMRIAGGASEARAA
jgi:hypothetical protein